MASAEIPNKKTQGVVSFGTYGVDVGIPGHFVVDRDSQVLRVGGFFQFLVVNRVFKFDGVLLVGHSQDLTLLWMELH